MASLALDVSQMKMIAIGVLVAIVLLAVLVGVLVRALFTKTAAIVILVVLAFAVWNQRSSLNHCAHTRHCEFFGYQVSADVP